MSWARTSGILCAVLFVACVSTLFEQHARARRCGDEECLVCWNHMQDDDAAVQCENELCRPWHADHNVDWLNGVFLKCPRCRSPNPKFKFAKFGDLKKQREAYVTAQIKKHVVAWNARKKALEKLTAKTLGSAAEIHKGFFNMMMKRSRERLIQHNWYEAQQLLGQIEEWFERRFLGPPPGDVENPCVICLNPMQDDDLARQCQNKLCRPWHAIVNSEDDDGWLKALSKCPSCSTPKPEFQVGRYRDLRKQREDYVKTHGGQTQIEE